MKYYISYDTCNKTKIKDGMNYVKFTGNHKDGWIGWPNYEDKDIFSSLKIARYLKFKYLNIASVYKVYNGIIPNSFKIHHEILD